MHRKAPHTAPHHTAPHARPRWRRMPMFEPELVTVAVTGCIVAAVLLAFAMVGCPVKERASDDVIQVAPAVGTETKAEP